MPRLETADYLAARNRDKRRMAQIDSRLRRIANLGEEDGVGALREAFIEVYRHLLGLDSAQRGASR